MSSHGKGKPIAPGYANLHLRCLMACSDEWIANALAGLPAYDLARLRRLLREPLKGVEPERKHAS